MVNLLKLRFDTLRSYFEQYEQAKDNPHLQNALVCAMRMECDRLNIAVVDYILEMQAKPQKVAGTKPAEAGSKEVAGKGLESRERVAPATGPVLPTDSTTFACNSCGKKFPTQKALSGHQKGHRKETAEREGKPALGLSAAGSG
ncbi:MAG: C2H2-type zinc finger protein [Cytophagales bacterium]|nr:C2H2-type zinc finger protein [Cytophagales bacterium]